MLGVRLPAAVRPNKKRSFSVGGLIRSVGSASASPRVGVTRWAVMIITSSVWLRELCDAMYEDEPRVTVDARPDPYYCYEWGKQLLLFHHGHKRKVANIDTVDALM